MCSSDLQRLRSDPAEAKNQVRVHKLDLPVKIRQTLDHFRRLGRPVGRRATFQNIRDIHRLARLPDGGQHRVQQLACPTDEWLTLTILVRSRRLADDHQPGLSVADAAARAMPILTAHNIGRTP